MKTFITKAFTKDKSKGNPAGVVLDADNLSDSEMLRIAQKLNFSESAFVSKSENSDFKVRFFSPKQEVDFCGHATIATFHLLNEQKLIRNKISTQETKIGVLEVEVEEDGRIVMTQSKPQFGFIEEDKNIVAKMLNIDASNIDDAPIMSVSTGTPKLIIPIKNLQALNSIEPNLEGIADYCRVKETKGFYPFTSETKYEQSDYHARQFNPLAGINEDPITGVAAGALGAYIVKNNLSDNTSFIIEQGFVMDMGGEIYVEVGDKVKVGGYGVVSEIVEI